MVSKQSDARGKMSTKGYFLDIVEGDVPDHHHHSKHGSNLTLGTSEALLWVVNTQYTYLAAADTLSITSSNDANDTANGTGARTVVICGLDANWDEQEETITLSGTTAIVTTKTFIRVNDGYVDTVGTGATNVGQILVKDSTSATTLLAIGIGFGRSQFGGWTVPQNQTAFMTRIWAAEGTNKGTSFRLYIRPFGKAWQIIKLIKLTSSFASSHFDFPLKVLEKSDIEFRAIAGSADANASGGFELWHETN